LFIFSLVVFPAALIVVYLVGIVEGRRDITMTEIEQTPPTPESRPTLRGLTADGATWPSERSWLSARAVRGDFRDLDGVLSSESLALIRR
jgi:hypothetical protein